MESGFEVWRRFTPQPAALAIAPKPARRAEWSIHWRRLISMRVAISRVTVPYDPPDLALQKTISEYRRVICDGISRVLARGASASTECIIPPPSTTESGCQAAITQSGPHYHSR